VWDKALDLVNGHPYHARLFGALAQLGERNTGSVEVSGSIPLGSTKNESLARKCGGFFVLDKFWHSYYSALIQMAPAK
jgi:hypothetical protein